MKTRSLPFSYLLHDDAIRTKNIGGLEGPAFKFLSGARFGSRRALVINIAYALIYQVYPLATTDKIPFVRAILPG